MSSGHCVLQDCITLRDVYIISSASFKQKPNTPYSLCYTVVAVEFWYSLSDSVSLLPGSCIELDSDCTGGSVFLVIQCIVHGLYFGEMFCSCKYFLNCSSWDVRCLLPSCVFTSWVSTCLCLWWLWLCVSRLVSGLISCHYCLTCSFEMFI